MTNQTDLIEELENIATKLDGELKRYTTHDSTGRQSKKIVIEYDIKNE
tara:strand:- start:2935 stop:3078 length:144 start_codon:yes stop_codon:yes gene_type:complete